MTFQWYFVGIASWRDIPENGTRFTSVLLIVFGHFGKDFNCGSTDKAAGAKL